MKDKRLKNLNPIKPGEVRNPNGRPKGSRNKFSEAFIGDFLKEWEIGGAEALRSVRENDPSTFLRVAASIVPKHYTIEEGDTALERLLEKYEDRELDQLIAGICAIGDAGKGQKGEKQAGLAEQSSKIH